MDQLTGIESPKSFGASTAAHDESPTASSDGSRSGSQGRELTHTFLVSPYVLEADDPLGRFEQIIRLAAALFMAAGVLGSIASLLPGANEYLNPRGIAVISLLAIVTGMGLLASYRFLNPLHMYGVLLAAVVMVTVSTYFAGQRSMGFAAMIYMWHTSISFCFLKKRWVILPVAMIAVGFATTLALENFTLLAVNAWVFTMGTVLVTGAFVALLVQHLHQAARAERVARTEAESAKEELYLLNRDLEDRVKGKILEVERLSELRRLVSSHVADALLQSDRALEPHRREIAVFFIDLRGFTRFAMDSDPEEVIQVLDEFYRVLGKAFNDYGATVGAFDGDGVMAYFNDPVPIEAPAQRAVDMALELLEPINSLVKRWRERDYDLNFGIGIALGYATMGMVGFEGRQDYTAIGTVVNLASRLCDEASEGMVLVDRRARQAIGKGANVEELEPMTLKGFRDPVPVFRVAPTSANA